LIAKSTYETRRIGVMAYTLPGPDDDGVDRTDGSSLRGKAVEVGDDRLFVGDGHVGASPPTPLQPLHSPLQSRRGSGEKEVLPGQTQGREGSVVHGRGETVLDWPADETHKFRSSRIQVATS